MKTIVLLSGGLDSATVLAGCVAAGDECLALACDYGQPHRIELERATAIASYYSVPFMTVDLPDMPKVDDVVFAGRNLAFASTGIAVAQAKGFQLVSVGCNASDWLRFPDCRPPFWQALEICAAAYGVSIDTPLIHMSKSDVVRAARKLNVPIDLTWSCYSPRGGEPCGECLACKTRDEALAA